MSPSDLKHEKLVQLLGQMIKNAFLNSDEYHVFCDAVRLAVEDDEDGQDELFISALTWVRDDFITQSKRIRAEKNNIEQVKSLLPEILSFLATPNGTKDNPN